MRSPPGYGANTADRNYPRSPQDMRGGYDDANLRTRDLGRGDNNPAPADIEMVTSNYVGNLTRKKRTLGE